MSVVRNLFSSFISLFISCENGADIWNIYWCNDATIIDWVTWSRVIHLILYICTVIKSWELWLVGPEEMPMSRAWVISAAKCALVFLEASQSTQMIPLLGVKIKSQEYLRARAILKLSRRNSMFPPRAFPELQQARVGDRTQSTISSLKN